MADLAHHARLFRWNGWANAETLRSLERVAPALALRWMAHIVGSEVLWLARLREEPSGMPVWPELDRDACATHLAALADAWPRHIAGLAEEDLADGVGYRNSRGEFWTSRVEDVLTHVITHSGYHRGQIAAAVRAAGGEPAYTDFIHATRQGLLE